MTLPSTGHSIIAGREVRGTAGEVRGHDPATDQPVDPPFTLLDTSQVREATSAAAEACAQLRELPPDRHGAFLDAIADNLEKVGGDVVARAGVETGLPEARLSGELARTTGQLRLFASVVRRGDHRGVRVDPAIPDRAPLPRADIRLRRVPLGPVAVFGASNFPLAFSTAGGDTASALAAGCPVIVKAHNAHPGTSLLVGRAVTDAVRDSGLHPGTFSLLYGPGSGIGQALAADPAIKAIGFTGSRGAGTALVRTAAARPEPIPVYAEMSSVNPVFVLPGALGGDGADPAGLARGFVTSLTASAGQLCTVPGLLFVPTGEAGDRFLDLVAEALRDTAAQTMLTAGIAGACQSGITALAAQEGVTEVATGGVGDNPKSPGAAVFSAPVSSFVANRALHEEIFGPACLAVRYDSVEELVPALRAMEGQLTASVHFTERDHDVVSALLPWLEDRAGRIVANGWPTGVEVGHAMVHGGPYPATSDSRTTSVGTLAIERFLRPVSYQNLPDGLLPLPLRADNPWHLTRLVDGELQVGPGVHD